MIKTRYNFLKRLYPNYIIFFKEKDKYIVYKDDILIIKFIIKKYSVNEKDLIKFKNMNYIIIENLNILKINKVKNNKYNEILKKQKLIEILCK